ncbi:MAG: FIST C-terminal domain-containing protein [Candidatus Omnitrophica bacterium]|nr:FIST C-terminal domain-containing protein [Candidatus Omnitrophota bacterium]MCB9720475.1 FIST C-terminal domain-containing protein [Candidatus Omnitrophota bacterium]
MEFASRTAVTGDMSQIVDELCIDAEKDFDIGLLFISAQLDEHIRDIERAVADRLPVSHLLACSCAGIIGSEREVEGAPAASLFLAKLPGVRCRTFHIEQEHIEQLNSSEDYYEMLEVYPNENSVFVLIPDPYQIDLNTFLEGMNEAYAGRPLVGGLASGSTQANGNVLIVNGEVHNRGMIGMALCGDIHIDTIVSQGCKPIGETYIVTKADKNIIYEVAGKTFLDILRQVFLDLNETERQLMQQALLVGIAMDEYTHDFGRGDFLVRPVIGIDQESGAVGIGDRIRAGQTIQLHLRDVKTAAEDLTELLKKFKKKRPSDNRGALVFSCNGRGEGLFGEPDHDITLIQKHLGPIPAAGFFCAGEIGPIGGKNFIHGFTDSIVVFSSD